MEESSSAGGTGGVRGSDGAGLAHQRVTDHLGQPLSKEVRFIANPSPDVGRVLSAESTLRKGKKPGWLSAGDACTFVGENGLHLIRVKGKADRVEADEVLRFSEARDLRTSLTVSLLGGSYQHHAFDFSWFDQGGKSLFRNQYLFHDKSLLSDGSGHPRDNSLGSSLYRFGAAAERVWTRLCLGRVNESFKRDGSVEFPLTGGEWLMLGRGTLEVSLGRTQRRFERGELGRVELRGGRWTITPAGAHKGVLGTKGEISFDNWSLANAKVFAVCLEKLLGISPY